MEIAFNITAHWRKRGAPYRDEVYAMIEAVNWIQQNIWFRSSMNYRANCSASNLMYILRKEAGIETDHRTMVALMRLAGFEFKEKDGETYFNISDKTEIVNDNRYRFCI